MKTEHCLRFAFLVKVLYGLSVTYDFCIGMRLNKYIAQAGICSRRKADELIERGLVRVNGNVVEMHGVQVDPQRDTVQVRNQIIEPATEHVYIKLNKPRGYTSTTRRHNTEHNVLELVKHRGRVFIVGRLDKESDGLIILTNDGEWAQEMMHPKYEVEKEYLVWVNRAISKSDMQTLKKGIKVDGEMMRAKVAERLDDKKIRLVLTEGKNREIRRMLDKMGYTVTRLKRIRIANIKLGGIESGKWQYFNL